MNRIYRQQTSKSGLFVMELILAILFFSFASAICIQVFAKAHLISTKSSDLTAAMAEVQSAAEILKSSDKNLSDLSQLLGAQQEEDVLTIYYDQEWNRAAAGRDTYRMMIRVADEGLLSSSDIQLFKEGESQPIYKIEVKTYHPHS